MDLKIEKTKEKQKRRDKKIKKTGRTQQRRSLCYV